MIIVGGKKWKNLHCAHSMSSLFVVKEMCNNHDYDLKIEVADCGGTLNGSSLVKLGRALYRLANISMTWDHFFCVVCPQKLGQ